MSDRPRHRLEIAFLLAVLAICGIYGLSLYRDSREALAERQRIGAAVKAEEKRQKAEQEVPEHPHLERSVVEQMRRNGLEGAGMIGIGSGLVR